MTAFPITKEGYIKLENEIKRLKSYDRPEIIKAIATAREFGDLSENAEYHAAKEKQSFIEGRIADLSGKLSSAEIIDLENIASDKVKFGATVDLIDEHDISSSYVIIGEYEANISKGLISISSPLAKALIGKKVGDNIELETPKGDKFFEIVKITYKKIQI